MTSHDFRAARTTVFVKNLVQNGLLLDAVDFVGCLRSHEEPLLLLADEAVVRRLWELLVHRALSAGASTSWNTTVVVNLLEQVVLLMAHHDKIRVAAVPTGVLLALLELVLQ